MGTVDEIAAQESDEGADGTMMQYPDMAAVVEDTTPGAGLVDGDAAARGSSRESRKRTKKHNYCKLQKRTKQPPPENLHDWAGLPYGSPSME